MAAIEDAAINVPVQRYAFSDRQLTDMRFCLYYAATCKHGADGHNRMIEVAMMAEALGFRLGKDHVTIYFLENQRHILGANRESLMAISGADIESWPEETREWLTIF